MNKEKIKLILFDIDNTLVFGEPAMNFYSQYSRTLERTLAKLLKTDEVEAKRIADDFRARFNGHGEIAYIELLGDISPWYKAIRTVKPRKYLPKFAEVNKLLGKLRRKGYLLGAITDGPTIQGESILRSAGISKQHFNLFMGWESNAAQPKGGKSDVYTRVAALYNLDPENIVMVGDTLRLDVLPAIEANLNAIHISDIETPDAKWLTVKNVLELNNIFLKENVCI
jgi:FMN phosphatase YigB (HAD superfamily)